MQLLDLPPELLEQIIVQFVNSVPVAKAWKARAVCNTFAIYIANQVFGHLPIRSFLSSESGKRLLENGMPLFLEYRLAVPDGAHEVLPSLIRKAVDEFMRLDNDEFMCLDVDEFMHLDDTKNTATKTIRDNYTKRACEAAARFCLVAWRLITKKPTPRMKTVHGNENPKNIAMAIAIGMKDEKIIQFLSNNGVSMWEHTEAFGWPVVVAAKTNCVKLLRLVLQCAQADGMNILNRRRGQMLFNAVHCPSISETMRLIIIESYLEHHGRPTFDPCAAIMEWAQAENNLHVIDKLFDCGHKGFADKYAQYVLADPWRWWTDTRPEEKTMDESVLGMMLDRGIIVVDKVYGSYTLSGRYGYHDLAKGSILDIAVTWRLHTLARRLLDMGADPDGLIRDDGSRIPPLVVAIEQRDKKMIALLMEYGADSDFGKWVEDADKALARSELLAPFLSPSKDKEAD